MPLAEQELLTLPEHLSSLTVLKFRAKRVKISINKEQRFPAASNFKEFDALMRNICLGSRKVCKTYWKRIYSIHNSVCIFTSAGIEITNHVIKKGT
jgi:hypothetical protein